MTASIFSGRCIIVTEIIEMFSFPFIIRAFAVGIMVSLCASLLGVGLVLRRFSMIGDGLSHVGYGALAVAAALHVSTPLYVSIPIVIAAAFLLLRLGGKSGAAGDSAIGMISSGALAVGTIIIALTTNSNADITAYMFGSIYALSDTDVWLCAALFVIVAVLFILFYNRIFAVTFDENFSRSAGININIYNITMALLTAVTVVIGMTLMGALLISALVIFPPVTAMRVCRSFRKVMVCAAIIGVAGLISGLFASYFLSTPPGASIVASDVVLYFAFSLCASLRCAASKR